MNNLKSSPWQAMAIIVCVLVIAFFAHAGYIDTSSVLTIGLIGNMSTSQARVIDPILSDLARGYQNAESVGHHLFPTVPVTQRGGKVLEFGKESFRLYATGRNPGENTKRVSFGHYGKDYSLEQHALEGVVPIEHQEEAAAVPGIDLGRGAVQGVQDIISLRLEKQRADIARNAGSYGANNKLTLSGNSLWGAYGTSNPSQDIRDAVESIRAQTAKRPNVALMGAKVFAQLQEHPLILDRIKYTGKDSITPDMLAALWNLKKVVVGDAIYEDDAGVMQDVWGNDVILAFTQIGTVRQRGLPSYGYTYQLGGYPIVEQPYYDRNAKSWLYPVTDEVRPVLAGADAGFIIKNAV